MFDEDQRGDGACEAIKSWRSDCSPSVLGHRLGGIYMIAAQDDGFDDLLAQLDQIEGTPEVAKSTD
jgi:hypothetical protein